MHHNGIEALIIALQGKHTDTAIRLGYGFTATKEIEDVVIQMYNAGCPKLRIAEKLWIGYSQVRRILRNKKGGLPQKR